MLGELYLWVKAAHVISVIAWMAGLLYLPRLYVYHAEVQAGSPQSETFKAMERLLLRAIMNPAMIAAYLFGGLMLWELSPGVWSEGWLHLKLAAVALMTWLHHVFGRWRTAFAEDRNTKTARSFRLANEAPTLLMVVIIVMAVVKPF